MMKIMKKNVRFVAETSKELSTIIKAETEYTSLLVSRI
jgi:hypothetical protein